ncbi:MULTISPECIES: Flp pilus assembly protein CpaB [Maricaulis]|jgi:pilus assembly protein CpaB|uniref:Flp pilus assembly CpaB n=1 Tax=Maricaulis maris (strain MCS10) TaxID=394221 RepID=Q0ASM6_MARMM|nr:MULTISPECIES: Flp pilus assembly protein CpaB [Maricaulis]ABI64711.1 Flp pilus assembly CpaB [Maricaulis maris MCS10]MAC88180.1 Flp pilus assembly protein CpaB [Maricaulis sp.]
MNAVRIAILAAAALAAVAVAFFVRQAMSSNEVAQVVEVEERPAVRILAARRDVEIGERISAADFYWQAWPDEALAPGYIVENRGQTIADFAGSVVRAPISQGEPITGRRLVQPGDAGFMAAVLTPGMRAVAVPISAETGAGGFILPNDRVDVIVSFEEETEGRRGAGRAFVARTIVENARVLAIDQSFSSEADDEVAVGETATLELTPDQARAVSVAVARGEIALVLRSLTDNSGAPVLVSGGELPEAPSQSFQERRSSSVTLIRYGRAQQVALGGDE